MAESFQGEAGLEKFRKDILTLMDTITAISKPEEVRFVIVTPLFHEALPAPLPNPNEHNANLEKYARALREIAAERKTALIDLFSTMGAYHRQANPPPFTD